MSYSVVKLYKTNILPERNIIVDRVDLYLASLTPLAFNNCMYHRHEINSSKKLDLGQVYVDYDSVYGYNYCSIQNSDSNRIVYYFITNKTQVAEHTIKIDLAMDTCNTFKYGVDIIANKKTRVIREHKDRWVSIPAPETPVTLDLGTHPVKMTTAVDSQVSGSIHIPIPEEYISKVTDANNISVNIIPFVQYSNVVVSALSIADEQISITLVCDASLNTIVRISVTYSYLDSNSYLQRVIDINSEGIQPVLYKTSQYELKDEFDMTWNLLYKTAKVLSEESDNAVTCKLIPEQTITTSIETGDGTLDYSKFTEGHSYYFFWVDDYALTTFNLKYISQEDTKITVNTKTFVVSCSPIWKGRELYGFVITRATGATNLTIKYVRYSFDTLGANYMDVIDTETASSVTFDNNLTITCFNNDSETLMTAVNFKNNAKANDQLTFSGYSIQTINSIKFVNRTESTLMKIIKIPYCPTDYTYNTNGISFIKDWQYEDNELILADTSTKFIHEVETNVNNPINYLYRIKDVSIDKSATAPRNDYYESKLYHSDFTQVKFIYDSFTFVFKLEEMYASTLEKFKFKFIMTSTMNSKFAFKFDSFQWYRPKEDYENILPVSRNNEVVIFNSTYLNYLRTSYNYDVKAKDRTITASSIGTGLAIAGSVASVGLSIATYNPALIVSAVIGATSAITSSIVSNVNTIVQAEASLENKVAQYKAQSVATAGSDDVDILESYSNNRAKLAIYQMSTRTSKAIADLFFYMGYATDEMKVPNVNTRKNFNFLQCELVFDSNPNNMTESIMNDIRQRYANGVTFLHRYSTSPNLWDWAQQYENWEANL